MITSLITHTVAIIIGVLLGGFIVRNNYAKSMALLETLKLRVNELSQQKK